MRLQTDLLAPGVVSPVWRTTPQTLELADRLAGELRALGYGVERSQDTAEDGAGEEQTYQELSLGGDEDISLAVLDGGGFVSADAWHDEPQRFWVSTMRLLRTVERVCGWTSPEAEAIAGYAARYSVRPDASVSRVAELDERQLAEEVTALARRHADDPDLPGRRLPMDAPAVVGVLSAAERLAAAGLPPFTAELDSEDGATGMSTPGLQGADHARVEADLDALMAAAAGLHDQVGDDRTGRLTRLRVHVGPPRGRLRRRPAEVRLEPVFDRLCLDGDRLQLGWLEIATMMSRRDAEWQPAWLPELRALLARAGMQV